MTDADPADGAVSRRGFLVASGTAGGAAVLQPSLSHARDVTGVPGRGAAEGAPPFAPAERPEAAAITRIVEAISLAVANVMAEGLDDVFPSPFELEDLARRPELRDRLERYVARRIVKADYGSLKPAHVVRIPKRNTRGFRLITVIDPTDYVTYLALCLLVAQTVEERRVPLAARRVYACRYAPRDGHLFRENLDFGGFRRAVRRHIARSGGQVFVTADIARFFPSVRRACVARRLAELGVAGWLRDAIDAMLAHWERCGVPGLPVGSNASRILSEAVLAHVDRTLLDRNINFLRFMDDFRFFAPDTETANLWLEILSATLSEDGLALSDVKTSMRDVPTDIDAARLGLPGSPFHLTTNACLVERGRATAPGPRLAAADDSGEGDDDLIILYKFNNTFRYVPYGKRGRGFARRLDLQALTAQLDGKTHLSRAGIRKFVNACLHQRAHGMLHRLPRYLRKVRSGTWYCVDFLIAERHALPLPLKRDLAEQFADELTAGAGWSGHEALALLRLLANPDYAQPAAVLRFYAELPADACAFLRRYALDSIYRCQAHMPPRDLVRTVSSVSPGSDPWCARALLRLARTHRELDDVAEASAAIVRDDPFAAVYTRPAWTAHA